MISTLRFKMGDSDYTVIVQYSSRRSISIRLEPESENILVRAPIGTGDGEVLRIVASKQRWIELRRENLREAQLNKRQFVDGEEHFLLGAPFTLRVVEGKRNISFDGNVLIISTPDTSAANVEKLLYKWYREQALDEIPKITAPLISSFAIKYRKMPSSIEYKRVHSYWGQCIGRDRIRLNTELVRARRSAIEMIVLHELCHLIHSNHSHRFYSLLETHCPSWKAEVKYLKDNVSLRY